MTESNPTPGLELPPYLIDGLGRWAHRARPDQVTAQRPQAPPPHQDHTDSHPNA